jgi:hypothetical protein
VGTFRKFIMKSSNVYAESFSLCILTFIKMKVIGGNLSGSC